MRELAGYWYGFVCVGPEHPLFGKEPSSCLATPPCEEAFCEYSLARMTEPVGSVYRAHRGLPEKTTPCPDPAHDHRELWHFGFDCCGLDDLAPGDPEHNAWVREQGHTPVYRTLEYVRDEVGRLADFLAELSSKPLVAPGHGDEYRQALEQGRREALEDWQRHRAHVTTFGLLTDSPHLDRETGLYVVTSGCMVDHLSDARDNAYDATIRELVAGHGIPDWAPGRRIPSKREALGALRVADPIASFDGIPFAYRGITHTIFGTWSDGPTVWRAWPEKRLLLFAGDESKRRGRIDAVDLASGGWLTTLKLDRSRLGPFPWDEGRQAFAGGASVCAGCGAPSSPTAEGMHDWIVCAAGLFGCGLVCAACAADHQHTGPWRRTRDLAVGVALDPDWDNFLFTRPVYAYTRLGHELVVHSYEESRPAESLLRPPLELALAPSGYHLVVLFRFGRDARWQLTRYSPFAVPPHLRAVPCVGGGPLPLEVIVSGGSAFVARAVRRVELPESFARSLEAALAEQAALDWPGATRYDRDESRLEWRKNDPVSFFGEVVARCRVDLGWA